MSKSSPLNFSSVYQIIVSLHGMGPPPAFSATPVNPSRRDDNSASAGRVAGPFITKHFKKIDGAVAE